MAKDKKIQLDDDDFKVFTSEAMESEPASEGWHHAVLAELVALPPQDKFKKVVYQGLMIFQLDEVYEGEGELAGTRKEARIYFDRVRGLGSSKKGTKFRAFLEGWRGSFKKGVATPRTFTDAELAAFGERGNGNGLDLKALVGHPVRILTTVKTAKTSDRLYTSVVKLGPAPKSGEDDFEKIIQVSSDYVRFKDRDQKEKERHEDDDDDEKPGSAPPEDLKKLPL